MKQFLIVLIMAASAAAQIGSGVTAGPTPKVASSGGGTVLGTASFSATGGVLSNAYYTGVVSSVVRNSAGNYTVNLSSSQPHITVAVAVSDDAFAGRFASLSGTPNLVTGVSSFTVGVVAVSGSCTGGCAQDAGMITVTVFRLGS